MSTGYSPNAWHYGGVFLSFLKAGDETGALAIQSEWRDIQACNVQSVEVVFAPMASLCLEQINTLSSVIETVLWEGQRRQIFTKLVLL